MPDNAYSIEELINIDMNALPCPECGEPLDTGLGFGRRDLECSDPDNCDFAESYPADRYFAALDALR